MSCINFRSYSFGLLLDVKRLILHATVRSKCQCLNSFKPTSSRFSHRNFFTRNPSIQSRKLCRSNICKMVYTGGTNIYVFLARFLFCSPLRALLKTKGYNFVTRLPNAFTRRRIFGFSQKKTSPLFLFRSLVWQYRDIIKDYCLLKAVYMFLCALAAEYGPFRFTYDRFFMEHVSEFMAQLGPVETDP